MQTEYIVIFWTTSSIKEAKAMAKLLLEKKLVGCCNIIPHVVSLYKWDNALQEEEEVQVLLKTTADLFSQVSSVIQQHASYEVPELLSVGIQEGSGAYLSWLQSVLTTF